MKTVDTRLDDETLARLDAIREMLSRQEKRKVSRSEAVRRVLAAGLPLEAERLGQLDADAPRPPERAAPPPRRARRRRRVKGASS
jgi:hypothetical protein